MTAILGVALPVTATSEDDIKIAGNSILLHEGRVQMLKITGNYS